jgi:hypothetical protein
MHFIIFVTACLIYRDGSRTFGWVDAVMMAPLKEYLEANMSSVMDPREFYITHIFYPERFSVSIILKALNVGCVLSFRALLTDITYLVCANTQQQYVMKSLFAKIVFFHCG